MTHAGLSRALFACLGLGAVDVAALNLAVLPAVRGTAVPRAAAPPALPAPLRTRSAPAQGRAPAQEHKHDARDIARATAASPAELAPAPAAAARRPEPVAVVEFEPASRRLDRHASSTLDDVLASLAAGDQVVVIGHADASGPDELNDRLSAARAAAVARRLRKAGISRSRIRLEAHGEREPRDDGNDRRVEIYLGGCP